MLRQVNQLKKEAAKKQRESSVANVARTAPLPAHWDAWEVTEKHKTVKYVVLPLPAGGVDNLSVLLRPVGLYGKRRF